MGFNSGGRAEQNVRLTIYFVSVEICLCNFMRHSEIPRILLVLLVKGNSIMKIFTAVFTNRDKGASWLQHVIWSKVLQWKHFSHDCMHYWFAVSKPELWQGFHILYFPNPTCNFLHSIAAIIIWLNLKFSFYLTPVATVTTRPLSPQCPCRIHHAHGSLTPSHWCPSRRPPRATTGAEGEDSQWPLTSHWAPPMATAQNMDPLSESPSESAFVRGCCMCVGLRRRERFKGGWCSRGQRTGWYMRFI